MRFLELLLLEKDFPHSEVVLSCENNLEIKTFSFGFHSGLITLDDFEGWRENFARLALTGIVANNLSFL